MAASTLYDLLGVRVDATIAELRTAKRATLKAVHPDHARELGLDEVRLAARTRAVLEACDTLLDRQKRAAYDVTIGLGRSRRLRILRLVLHEWRADLAVRRGSVELPRPHAPRISAPRVSPPRLHAPRPALDGRLGSLARTLRDTRFGQWLIVLACSTAADALLGGFVVAAHGITVLAVGLGLALWLARGGWPTPLSDARRVMFALARVILVLVRLGVASSRAPKTA